MKTAPLPAAFRVPPWAWMLLFLLLVGVCAVACGPRVPPPLWTSDVPPLPEVVVEEWPAEDDPCGIETFGAGDPMPSVLLKREANGTVAVSLCSGVIVPSALAAQWSAWKTALPAWKAAAEHQHADAVRSRLIGQAGYDGVWTYADQLRREATVRTWTALGLGALGLVAGVAIGVVADDAAGLVNAVRPFTLTIRWGR